MAIRIFITGGTFDKAYNELNGSLFFKDTHVAEILKLGRSNVPVEMTTLMMMDSLEMKERDRATIAGYCKGAWENKIIVTHGTDTMVETAKMIAKEVTNKTVVLTGAMIPYQFRSSDGLFNMGNAIAFVQVLPPGVYIAMNGRYFHWDNVYKNKMTGEFCELNTEYAK